MNESRTWTKAEIDALIDAKVKERSWSKNDVMTFANVIIGAVLTILGIFYGNEVVATGRVAKAVSDRQVVHEQKTEDVKAAIDAEKAAVDQKLQRIEKSTAAVENRIQVVKP